MRHTCWLVALAALAFTPRLHAAAEASRKPRVEQSAIRVGAHEKVELTVELPTSYDNPFDPAQISIVGAFRTPSRKTISVPGFYYVPYRRSRDADGNEVLEPAGPGVFKIRFAGAETGRHRFEVTAEDAAGTRQVGAGSFIVEPRRSGGYVRRSPAAPYFQLDSGESYFPIGENMCWPGDGGTYDYDLWMGRLRENGGNHIRLWLVNEWNKLGLEHRSLSPDDGNGLGRYNQQAAWRVDHILGLAERMGMRVLMCIDSFNSLDDGGIYGMWDKCAYNAANGGPCRTPPEFFTDPEAKRLFRQRLRYLVARWGYSTSVLAWEFWNEVDIITGYDSAAVTAWHQEMGRCLKAMDPWRHLVTTSFARTPGDPAIDALPEMDFVQSHSYGSRDMAGTISTVDTEKVARFGKPHYFGEFGADWLGEDNPADPTGIHLHNGIWAAMMSRSAGAPMIWWWDSYVEPYDLYHHFASAATFAKDVDWVREDYASAPVLSLRYAPGQQPTSHWPLSVRPRGESWEEASSYNSPHTYEVGNDGQITGIEMLSRVQHGIVNHPGWHNPATFVVRYPVAGRFEVNVRGVSGHGGAKLVISLDGEPALTVDMPDTLPHDTAMVREYDGAHGIDVPPGAHTIIVENTGADWCRVSYHLTNYLTPPHLRVLALSNPTSALMWVQNEDNTWSRRRDRAQPEAEGACEVTLGGLVPGDYEIEQWDTYTGAVTGRRTGTSENGALTITTPPGLTTDTAYKIRKR